MVSCSILFFASCEKDDHDDHDDHDGHDHSMNIDFTKENDADYYA